MSRYVIGQLSEQRFQRQRTVWRHVHQPLEIELSRHLQLVEEEVAGERRVDIDRARLLKIDQQRDRLSVPANPLLAIAVQEIEYGLVSDVLLQHGRVAVLDQSGKIRVLRCRLIRRK